ELGAARERVRTAHFVGIETRRVAVPTLINPFRKVSPVVGGGRAGGRADHAGSRRWRQDSAQKQRKATRGAQVAAVLGFLRSDDPLFRPEPKPTQPNHLSTAGSLALFLGGVLTPPARPSVIRAPAR